MWDLATLPVVRLDCVEAILLTVSVMQTAMVEETAALTLTLHAKLVCMYIRSLTVFANLDPLK